MTGRNELLKAGLLFLFFFLSLVSHGQERKLELSLKASVMLLAGNDTPLTDREVTLFGAGLESVYFVNRYFGVGAFFYEYPAIGYTDGYINDKNVEFDTRGRSFGMSLQLTSNKNRRFRIYANGKYSYLQLRDAGGYDQFYIYNKGYVISAGIGVMLKISRGVNFNLFEAHYLMPSKELSYSDNVALKGLSVGSGFTFKMIRAK